MLLTNRKLAFAARQKVGILWVAATPRIDVTEDKGEVFASDAVTTDEEKLVDISFLPMTNCSIDLSDECCSTDT